MKKKIIIPALLLVAVTTMVSGCVKDEQAVIDNRPVVVSNSYSEEFDDVSKLSAKGWVIYNNSIPTGVEGWRQGKYEVKYDNFLGQIVDGFPAYTATKSPTDYAGVDFNAGTIGAVASCWLITPPTNIKNGDVVSFFTRAHGDYPDRLQVLANITTDKTNIGTTATSVGDFTTPWLDINPSLSLTGYPLSWTKYTITVSGLAANALVKARIAFRYYIPNTNTAGDMIGIDSFQFLSK